MYSLFKKNKSKLREKEMESVHERTHVGERIK